MDLPDIGVSGIISLLIAASAIIGFIKGLIRTVLAMVCLSLAGYAAFWSNNHATDLTNSWMESPSPWIPTIIAVVAGLIVLFIARYLLKFLINPFDNSDKCKRVGSGIPSAFICFVLGIGILWAILTGIRYAGNLTQIKQTRTLAIDLTQKTGIFENTPLLLKAKQAIDNCTLGKWHQKTDPFHIPGKVILCRLLVMYQNTESRVEMLKVPQIHKVLNHPTFINLAFDEKIKKVIHSDDPKDLYQHADVLTALEDNQLRTDLLTLSDPLLDSLDQEVTR